MKTKVFLVVMATLFLVNYSSWGQIVTTITASGNDYVVPYGSYPNEPLVKIVMEKVAPSQVKIGFGWTTNSWNGPIGHSETGSTNSFITVSLPGPYNNVGDGGGSTTVNYISWPEIWLNGTKMGNITHNGTQFLYADGITPEMFQVEQSGGYVELHIANSSDVVEVKLDDWFTYTGQNLGVNRLWSYIVTSGWPTDRVGQNQSSYVLPLQTSFYTVGTGDGSVATPGNYVLFSVVYPTPITPTVTEITVSPPSSSVEKGQTQQFTAQVHGANDPAQTVTWSVEGGAVWAGSAISASGLLSIGSDEPAVTLTVRATSTVDPTKSGTAGVTVTAPPVVYKITATDDGHSTLSPAGELSVPAGGSQAFTASYDAGYERHQLRVDGSTVNADTYTFTNVQANHTISLSSKATLYSITYHLNGGNGGTSGVYTVETNAITLPVPTRDGFVFQGWYENEDLTGSPVTVLAAGSTGNKVYRAKWEAVNSSDATLNKLTVNAGNLTPEFNPTVSVYTVNVSNGITKITVTGTANHAKAAVSGNVTDKSLNVGDNVITITVTAEDGSARIYTVTVVRAEKPAPFPVFDGLADEYSLSQTEIPLKMKGKDAEKLTVFKVNGQTASKFVPSVKGKYTVEALSANGKLRIIKYVKVN